MIRIFFLFFFLIFIQVTFGQNLVPNPSFEDYTTCPDAENEVSRLVGWSSYGYSPDYFNSCDPADYVSVPFNFGGYQHASSGNAYCGLIAYAGPPYTVHDLREFIGQQLSAPLSVGTKYYVSFKASLSISSIIPSNCSVNNLGMAFSTNPYNIVTPAQISNSAQVFQHSRLDDSLNWTNVTGSFIADSSYDYIMLGNFFSNVHTDTLIMTNDTFCLSYYYIDDICVATDSAYAATYTGIQPINKDILFSMYPNPTSGVFSIHNPALTGAYDLEIFNSLGKKIFVKMNVDDDDFNIDLTDFAGNIFIVRLKYYDKTYYYKLIKQSP